MSALKMFPATRSTRPARPDRGFDAVLQAIGGHRQGQVEAFQGPLHAGDGLDAGCDQVFGLGAQVTEQGRGQGDAEALLDQVEDVPGGQAESAMQQGFQFGARSVGGQAVEDDALG
ncbi:hypothetical protein Q3H58_002639 [Pseudomonas psychrotolerans]|nr:hypothetical protein [Pseudomonas psychrotolerans]